MGFSCYGIVEKRELAFKSECYKVHFKDVRATNEWYQSYDC